MPFTLSGVPNEIPNRFTNGNRNKTIMLHCNLVGPASYTTGGETYATLSKALGLTSIEYLSGHVTSGVNRSITHDAANDKILAFGATGSQESGSADLSTLTYSTLVIGTAP